MQAGAKAVGAQSEQMRRREEARKLALGGTMAEWKEGKLLPEGWDDMQFSQKVVFSRLPQLKPMFDACWATALATGAWSSGLQS